MENQTITITLEEYKELRDKIEEYSILIGEYKFLYQICKEFLDPEEVKEKRLIGFNR